jgi:hypothetical protein
MHHLVYLLLFMVLSCGDTNNDAFESVFRAPYNWFNDLAAMISVLHAITKLVGTEGLQFDPGLNQYKQNTSTFYSLALVWVLISLSEIFPPPLQGSMV